MPEERVRVVVLNYNKAEMTAECIPYVRRQSYRPLDIVVVDNGSTEEEYQKLQSALPDDIYIARCSSNRGYSAGNNVGARLDNGMPLSTYTMIVNNDVLMKDRQTIDRLVSSLQGDPSLVAVSPLVNTLSSPLPPEAQIQVRRRPDYISCLMSYSCWLGRIPFFRPLYDWHTYRDQRPYQRGFPVPCETINGSCFLIKSDFLRGMGYLDEVTFLYFEEILLGWTIGNRGGRSLLATDCWVDHHQGATSAYKKGQFRAESFFYEFKSQAHYCRAYLKANEFQIALLAAVRAIDFMGKMMASLSDNLLS